MVRDPPALISYQQGRAKVADMDKQLMARDEFLEEIRAQLVQAQVTIKNIQDKSRRELEFLVGDCVWLHLLQQTLVRGNGRLSF